MATPIAPSPEKQCVPLTPLSVRHPLRDAQAANASRGPGTAREDSARGGAAAPSRVASGCRTCSGLLPPPTSFSRGEDAPWPLAAGPRTSPHTGTAREAPSHTCSPTPLPFRLALTGTVLFQGLLSPGGRAGRRPAPGPQGALLTDEETEAERR